MPVAGDHKCSSAVISDDDRKIGIVVENPLADHDAVRVEALQVEVEQLRARVALLEAEKAVLLRAAAERDYERPPHYQ